MKSIDIVLPVYNEENGLEEFNRVLFGTLNTLKSNYSFTVIYVVDKCGDNSFKVVERMAKQYDNIVGLELSSRFGHQNSLMAGLSVCKGDAAIMMDSDLEHPPSLIPQMLEYYEKGFEIVYTERVYNEKVRLMKKLSSSLYYHVINSLSSVTLNGASADFRLISKKVRLALTTQIKEQNPFLRGVLPWMGFSSSKVTYTSGVRLAGESKYNFTRMLQFGIGGVVSFSNKPLYFTIYIGIFFAVLSMLYILYLILGFFLGSKGPEGWLTTIVFVAFIGSLQLMSLGIIGLYIGKIFEETKGRPTFIIENMTGKPQNVMQGFEEKSFQHKESAVVEDPR